MFCLGLITGLVVGYVLGFITPIVIVFVGYYWTTRHGIN